MDADPSRQAPHLIETGRIELRILESASEMAEVEALQRVVWPGNETEVVPVHLLVTAAHNGGLVMGAYDADRLVGFVFGFLGLHEMDGEKRIKHCSHMLGVHPDYRDRGLGFQLKLAQRQVVRRQGIDLITWTFDPLLSRNAHLNIAKLGGVSQTYLRDIYGELPDGINAGLPSDRLRVDWWINSTRVERRLADLERRPVTLSQYLDAGAPIVNEPEWGADHLPHPATSLEEALARAEDRPGSCIVTVLVEIPADFLALKSASRELAIAWRHHTRQLFEALFEQDYVVIDFIHQREPLARSFYVLTRSSACAI